MVRSLMRRFSEQHNAFSATWDDETGTPRHSTRIGRWTNEVERCDVLDAYYKNDSLYRSLDAELSDRRYQGYTGLRNPAGRLVEIYVAKLTDRLFDSLDTHNNPELKKQIEQLYEWSNWKDKVEEAARDLSIFGVCWVKVENNDEANPTRVQRNLIDPRCIVDFDLDARDILTYIRIDTEFDRDLGGGSMEPWWRVEVWDKRSDDPAEQTVEVYEHHIGPEADMDDVRNTRAENTTLIRRAFIGEELPAGRTSGQFTGFTFIPIVCRRIRVRRDDPRGRGVFQHILDAIDELARQATKLSQMMFPDVYCVITREKGSRGGNVPNMHLEGEDARRALQRAQQEGYRIVDVEGIRTIVLGEGQNLQWSVPPLDFSGHIAAMNDFVKESIEKDAPELAYYRLREFGQPPSGVAADTMMADLRDRILAVRFKFEDMEVRLNKMALSIAKALGLDGFESVGDYDSGDLDHDFKPYVLFPKSPMEQAQEAQADASALAAYVALPEPILRRYLEERGFDEDQIAAILKDVSDAKAATQQAAAPADTAAPAATAILDTVVAQRDAAERAAVARFATRPGDVNIVAGSATTASPLLGETGDVRLFPAANGGR